MRWFIILRAHDVFWVTNSLSKEKTVNINASKKTNRVCCTLFLSLVEVSLVEVSLVEGTAF
jgi:hypothetical protein